MKVAEMNLGNDKFPFYGINQNKPLNNNQVWPGGSTLPNRDRTADLPNETGPTDKSVDAFTSTMMTHDTEPQ